MALASVFWDSEGVLMIGYIERGKTVTGFYYAELIRKLRSAIKEKRRVVLQVPGGPPNILRVITFFTMNLQDYDYLRLPYSEGRPTRTALRFLTANSLLTDCRRNVICDVILFTVYCVMH